MTPQASHTPGPWEAYCDSDCNQWQVNDIDQTEIVATGIETESNARLIAAAPELLSALQFMVDAFNVEEIDPLVAFMTIERARAVIFKATQPEVKR